MIPAQPALELRAPLPAAVAEAEGALEAAEPEAEEAREVESEAAPVGEPEAGVV